MSKLSCWKKPSTATKKLSMSWKRNATNKRMRLRSLRNRSQRLLKLRHNSQSPKKRSPKKKSPKRKIPSKKKLQN